MAANPIPFQPESIFHVYNRANGNENLFNDDRDYRVFISFMIRLLVPIAQPISYCLMPNHFHWLIRIKNESELRKIAARHECPDLPSDKFVSRQLAILFGSYVQYYNSVNSRQGSLFNRGVKRKHVSDNEYLMKLIGYIHTNPVVAGLCATCQEWEYSSYHLITGNSYSPLADLEVLQLYGEIGNFKQAHESLVQT